MKLINDTQDPQLVGIIETEADVVETRKIVDNLNRDLFDSGFDQYHYGTVQRGNKLYVERIEGAE